MTQTDTSAPLSVPLPTRRTLLLGLLLVNTQAVLAVVYLLSSGAPTGSPLYLAYSAAWISVSVFIFGFVRPPAAETRTKRRAAAVGLGYFGLLAVAGGLIGPGVGAAATGLRIAPLPPGRGPALLYSGELLNVTLMPVYVLGYLALTYLVYVTVVDAAGPAVAGVLGLFSCVSCSWPIVAGIAGSIFGSGSFLAASALELSFDLSTIVFLLTVALLYWRPLVGEPLATRS
ncbi:DUF7546 family protein [Haloferacaceae archaeon DSL9]